MKNYIVQRIHNHEVNSGSFENMSKALLQEYRTLQTEGSDVIEVYDSDAITSTPRSDVNLSTALTPVDARDILYKNLGIDNSLNVASPMSDSAKEEYAPIIGTLKMEEHAVVYYR